MQQPALCTACGAENIQGDKFCRQCGEKLLQYCPQCGTIIDTPSKFCHECGARLEPQTIAEDTPTEDTPAENTPAQEPQTITPITPESTYPEAPAPKKRGSNKSLFGVIAIGASIILLLVGLAIGILFVLDFLSCSPSSPVMPDIQTAEPAPEQQPVAIDPPVILSFTIDPPKITTAESTMATWEVTGADKISIDHEVGEVAPTGSMSLSPAQSTVYRLTASNDGGNVTRTASVTVIENVRAKDIALKPEDVGPDGYQFRHDYAPSMKDTISTYGANYRLGEESMDNLVVIYTTVSKAVTSFYEIKSNHKQYVTDILDIGDLAYYSTITELLPEETDMYIIYFQKNNVYVSIGECSNLDRLVKYAKLVESRIQ